MGPSVSMYLSCAALAVSKARSSMPCANDFLVANLFTSIFLIVSVCKIGKFITFSSKNDPNFAQKHKALIRLSHISLIQVRIQLEKKTNNAHQFVLRFSDLSSSSS